jgi:SRSO17 transposase
MGKRYTIAKESVFEDCFVTPEAYKGVFERLEQFVSPLFSDTFTRMQRDKALAYTKGLLSNLEKKNVESIAYSHGYDRQPLQIFIGQTQWDDDVILDKLADQVALKIGRDDGILVIDPTSFPKKGEMSIGVQRQWCGRLGKVDNCQVATFVAYVAGGHFTLVDRALYLPKEWTDDPTRCRVAGVPEEHIVEKTRHEQALEMLQGRCKKLPHKWIAGDDEMGRIPWFRKELRNLNEPYMLAIPSNFLIADLESSSTFCKQCNEIDESEIVNVRQWADRIPAYRWKTIKVRQGHKGWLKVRLVKCRVRAMIENEIGDEETLIVSRWRDDTGKNRTDYYLSHGNDDSKLDEYARVIKDAYRVEECFHRGKGECGLNDYQVRNWRGWHHHITLSMLALWFLTKEVILQKKAYR